jgi:hypothetical protein
MAIEPLQNGGPDAHPANCPDNAHLYVKTKNIFRISLDFLKYLYYVE